MNKKGNVIANLALILGGGLLAITLLAQPLLDTNKQTFANGIEEGKKQIRAEAVLRNFGHYEIDPVTVVASFVWNTPASATGTPNLPEQQP